VSDTKECFAEDVVGLLQRFMRQNQMTELPEQEARLCAERFWTVVSTRPMPRGLRAEQMGEPGEMTAEEILPLQEQVIGEHPRAAELAPVVRQLIKACYHPEFKKCRDSYREREDDGSCRRQSLTKVRARISGSHCVDCPYWTALTPAQHEACLAEGWAGDVTQLRRQRDLFLPEDFRAFRKLVRSLAPSSLADERR
jgi:hypothetical protein